MMRRRAQPIGLVSCLVLSIGVVMACSGGGERAPEAPLELVESWPLETVLDQPSVPDASVVWRQMIDSAETSLDFAEFYGFNAEGTELDAIVSAIERAADRGVTLAPGAIFGAGYEAWARFCFTATDRQTLEEGIGIFNEVLRTT